MSNVHSLNADSSFEAASLLADLSATDLSRVEEVKVQLQADPQKIVVSETSHHTRLTALVNRIESLAKTYNETAIEKYRELTDDSLVKAEAASIAANEAFTSEPLDGIGSSTWKALWEAARQYSQKSAYPTKHFPNTDDAFCVLCQQPLDPNAVARLWQSG